MTDDISGIWSEKYALGEKLFIAERRTASCSDDTIKEDLRLYCDTYPSSIAKYQERAEWFLKLLDAPHKAKVESTASPTFHALFGPIERSPQNIQRIHDITRAAACAPGAYDEAPDYNPERLNEE
jgi:hypothetical protein